MAKIASPPDQAQLTSQLKSHQGRFLTRPHPHPRLPHAPTPPPDALFASAPPPRPPAVRLPFAPLEALSYSVITQSENPDGHQTAQSGVRYTFALPVMTSLRQAEDTGWAEKSSLPSLQPIYFHSCHNWHLVRMPRSRFTSRRRGGKIQFFGPFSGDFVTCLKFSYMDRLTCDQGEKILSSARKAPHAPAAAHAASPLLRTYYPHIRARATAHLCLWRNACEGAGAWRNRLLPGGNTDLVCRVAGPFRGFETVDGRGFGRHGTTEHDGSMHIIYIYWLAEINRGPPICQKGSAYPQTDADKPSPTPATAVPSPVPFRRDFRNLAGVLNFAHRPPIKTAVPVDSYAGISAVEVPRFVLGSALYI
ncbi:hypothetical protein GGX14DRAFT_673059 [Mycena pura]|uniref:Uncharacterized protein n=1 Tax=Mycena pura TaxID=153505 RepID=A0AAD6Y8J0_9AGAR|nr:hypothetical protein GGX14DRAFT_673059 [Mycena pura]